MKKLIRYFLSGLIIVLPITITGYIIYSMITWVDSIFPIFIFPGFGIIVVIIAITIIGLLANIFIGKPLFQWIDKVLSGLPLISLLYKAIKDILESLVGQDSKLKIPVAVRLSDTGNLKLGFITQEYLDTTFVKGEIAYMAVYFPHSYNFSGNLLLVPAENVTKLEKDSSVIMKFIVSGGIIKDESAAEIA
jgi:uncharacterized membrane protein